MRLRTLLYEKEMLEKKIAELKNIMKYNAVDNIAQELFSQLELLRAKKITIDTINNKIKINIGEKKVNTSTVVILRDAVKDKIDVLTSLIINDECRLDKIELMKQRDDIYNEEYILLSNEITLSDLNVKIGE